MQLDPDICRRLVNVFGKLSVAEIEGAQSDLLLKEFFPQHHNFESVERLPGYASCYANVKEQKLILENVRDKLNTADEQVKTCLRLIDQSRSPEDRPLLHHILLPLIQGWFVTSRHWDQRARDKYNEGVVYITEWMDFFLSYTNRGKPHTNNAFKRLITHVFGNGIFKQRAERNCVTPVIQQYLTDQRLQGFWDVKNIQCGDDIAQKIYEYCRKAYTMVQFIEIASFRSEDGENWCWNEYSEFCKTRSALTSRLGRKVTNYFVITPPVAETENLIPVNPPRDYRDWITEITKDSAIRLRNDKIDPWEMDKEFGHLAKRIKEERDRFVDHLLAE